MVFSFHVATFGCKKLRKRIILATARDLTPFHSFPYNLLTRPPFVGIVLGKDWDSVVVDTEKTAGECIQYLKDQRIGIATFLPLDTMQVKSVNPNLKGMHRGMRLAIDTIEYDSAYERVMSSVCGNAMICDDLKVAKYLCYEKGVQATAVTIDGTKIHKGGLMTGGQGRNDRQRRWDDAEVESLHQIRIKLMGELASLNPQNDRRRIHEEETVQGELTGLEQRLEYFKTEVKALERNIQSKKKEFDFSKSQLKEMQPKYKEQIQGVENIKAKLDSFQGSVSKVEDKVFASFCVRLGYNDIRAYEAQQGSLQQEAQKKKQEFSTQVTKLQNQLNFESTRLQQTQDRIKNIERDSKRDAGLIAQLEKEKLAIQDEIDSISAELEEFNLQLADLQGKAGEQSEKVTEQRREFQKRSKSVEDSLKAVAELEGEVQRKSAERYALWRKCRIEEIKLPLSTNSNDLSSLPLIDAQAGGDPDAMDVDDEDNTIAGATEDYGIEVDFEDLDEDLKEESSEKTEEALQDTIKSLESELEKMAPNMRANDRLESVETRLKASDKEFDSARRAAKKAKDDFEAVKSKRQELFKKAFAHISEQIQGVYKDLTRSAQTPLGGQAYLDCEDGEDDNGEPYLHGVKYHAMPPLKRFRDMEHLSGGEKTMAALALLFAVHSYQPSPFFVLDEVDAALDNANVAKLVGYIRRNAGPGMQFIVISLKAGLFEGSETLVGVMRDQGVNSSKALTLDVSLPTFALPHIVLKSAC
jgi:structural maintenance of chromosome 1